MVERGVGLVKKKRRIAFSVFFFNDTATTEIYTLSLHDALPILPTALGLGAKLHSVVAMVCGMITFYFLKVVKANDTLLAMAETEEETSKFSVLLHALLENQEMYEIGRAHV